MKGVSVSRKDFVIAYRDVIRNGGTKADLAAKIGQTVSTVSARASELRGLGVDLPKFSRAKKQVNIEELNAILKS